MTVLLDGEPRRRRVDRRQRAHHRRHDRPRQDQASADRARRRQGRPRTPSSCTCRSGSRISRSTSATGSCTSPSPIASATATRRTTRPPPATSTRAPTTKAATSPASQQTIEDGYFDALGVRTLWLSPPNANPDRARARHRRPPVHRLSRLLAVGGPRRRSRASATLAALKSLVARRARARHPRDHRRRAQPRARTSTRTGSSTRTTAGSTVRRQPACTCGRPPGCGDWDDAARSTVGSSPTCRTSTTRTSTRSTAMIDDALFWAREVDVDGFRVDAVKHFLLTRDHARCARKLHDHFEHAGPLFYLVGETFDGDRGAHQQLHRAARAARAVRLPRLLRAARRAGAATRRRCASLEARDGAVGHGVRRRADVAVPRQPRRDALSLRRRPAC